MIIKTKNAGNVIGIRILFINNISTTTFKSKLGLHARLYKLNKKVINNKAEEEFYFGGTPLAAPGLGARRADRRAERAAHAAAVCINQ